ncbi:MAG: NUDIX domain-containing protein [Planctomycetia bacterium]
MKQSSGTLLYRRGPRGVEVLLVHPSGVYSRRAPWGIPKGAPNDGEDMEAAARRETLEETGVSVGPLEPFGYVDYTRSAKRVYCFVGPAPADCTPCCASWEVDRVEFVPLDDARRIVHVDQRRLLDRFDGWLAEQDEVPAQTPPADQE